MKRQILLSIIILFASINMFSQTQRNTYSKEWKKVEGFIDKSLPQSAIKEVQSILDLAVKDKNVPQIMRAYVSMEYFNRQIDSKHQPELIGRLEGLIKETANPIDKVLIHSVLAEMYFEVYNRDKWNINQRTNLSDDIPADIQEWSANIFENKIFEHLEATVKDKDILKKATPEIYDDIIQLGEDSRTYRPTLYDFIITRTINTAKLLRGIGHEEFDPLKATGINTEKLIILAKDYTQLNITPTQRYMVFKYYQEYLSDLLDRKMFESVVLVELDKYTYVKNLSNDLYSENEQKDRLNILKAYNKEYQNYETIVEIIDELADELFFARSSWRYTQDSEQKEDPQKRYDEVYALLNDGIKRYPEYKRINILKNKLANLESPTLEIKGKNLFYGNENIIVDITHKNNQLVDGKKTLDLYQIENEKKTLVKTFSITYDSKKTYFAENTKLEIGQLPYGEYYLKSKESQKTYGSRKDSLTFSVSDLMTYYRHSGKKEQEIFVVDRRNGKPIEGATISVFYYDSKKDGLKEKTLATLTTDHQGSAKFIDKRSDKEYWDKTPAYRISLNSDKYLPPQALYRDYNNYDNVSAVRNNQKERYATSIFADRSIYRPGQTLYYKAIVLNKDSQPVPNRKQVIKLYNPNHEVISEQTIFTNEFGSVAGTFILPQGGLLGSHRIEVNGESNLYIDVEEYKRPTFEVKFDKIEKTFSFGDKITLKGNAKTFSGISLQNTEVEYMITRQPFSFWFWQSSNGSHYQDGTVTTKDDGTFEIEFVPETGDGQKLFGGNIYTFNVTATVTDLNGETQSATYTISVGDVSMILNVEMLDKIEKSQDLIMIRIGAKNLDGADIETSGSFTIHSLDKNDSIQTKVLDGTFKSGEQKELAEKIRKLSSGKYRLEVKAKDDNGREVSASSDFTIYSYSDKRPPIETDNWFVLKETVFKGNKPAEIIYGTSRKDAYILYQVYNNKKIFDSKFIRFNNENQTFKITYKAEYGEEVYLSLTAINDGVPTTQHALLRKEKEEKDTKLNIKLDVFRDKLLPGQEESWTLSVLNDKGEAVSAEVLASMYDISLDKIYPFARWMMSRPYIYKESLRPIWYYNNVNNGQQVYNIHLKYPSLIKSISYFNFDRLILDPLFVKGNLGEIVVTGYAPQMKRSLTGAVSKLEGKVAGVQVLQENSTNMRIRGVSSIAAEEEVADQIIQFTAPAEYKEERVPSEEDITPEVQIRRNFNETAFFFPQLKTNDKGETVVSFTVPESNTTWRFRAFAHDKEGKVGELEKMVVTRKELMVTPNMPRFLRQGDITSISTKISNLSENAISGKVRIEFFNPIDEKAIEIEVDNQQQTFSLKKDASSSASWSFNVPKDIEMIGVRIVAESEYFSDGEQHALAILPNRMLVTETMPVDVTEKGEQTYTMDKLLNNKSATLENYKLTFEFTSNPIWYAIQALPTMSNPTSENAFNWFASYYANTLGTSLMKQYPKVSNIIKAWKAQGGDKQTLVSKLMKNEELKTILLEETPWVLDAKDETEQMERLSLLFDLNNTKQLTSTAIKKLEELQMYSGAWSWYKGMYPNRSLTQYLLFAFATLQRVGMVEYPQEVKQMQINALKYADNEIIDDYENIKKQKDYLKITSISTTQLEYLYTRAMYRDIPISHEAREAERFYTDIVSKNWTKLGLYEKSLLAVLAKELGNKELAKNITKSIKEHAVVNKELGMYWPNNRSRTFLSMSAVSGHIFLMEALKENGATVEEMDMMKRWLIKQKQTQGWETTNATIHAIAILLQDGSKWIETDSNPIIKVGNNAVNVENKELGTGYFKTSWPASEIKPEMGKITLQSEDNRPAYGSLYWQYYEDLDKITKQDGKLNIEKELYKEVTSADGKSLKKITENNPLQISDKVVVRLVLRTDRDMEFVQLKDMRASCFEPIQTTSGIGWQNRIPYYQTTKDASTNFFIDVLPKGTYVFEYSVYVSRSGEYSNGITSIQCAYAPEFTAHSKGIKVKVQ